MKIFITGATGYIGQRLMARLLERGYDVHALVRSIPNDPAFNHSNLTLFEGDLLNKASIEKAMQGCSKVFHLAAFARPWAKDSTTYFKINVEGTINVLEVARQQEIEKLVFSSSCGLFGRSNGKPITEDHVRDIDFFTEYDSSKYVAETHVLQYSGEGMQTVVVSPSKVYGPGVWTESNAVSQLIRSYVGGDWHVIPGNGKMTGCFCYVDDVVEGHLLAMEHGRSGEKYILGGENLTLNEFFKLVRRESGMNYFLVHVPILLMMLFGWKEEMAASLLGRNPLITRKWINKYKYDLACSSEKAESELGYRRTPFSEGVAKTLKWIAEEKSIYY